MGYISDLIKANELERVLMIQLKKQFSAIIRNLEQALKSDDIKKDDEVFNQTVSKIESLEKKVEDAERFVKVIDNKIKQLKMKQLK